MIKKFISGKLTPGTHWKIFKKLLLASNAAGLVIYAILHLILFDFPFEIEYEMVVLLKLFLVSGSFAASISLLLLIADGAEFIFKRSKLAAVPVYAKHISVAVLLLIFILAA